MTGTRVKVLLAALLLCGFAAVPTAPASAAPGDLCADQVAATRALQARIAAHNATPHQFKLPDQAAALDAFNAEAAALNVQKAAVLARAQACVEAMAALADTDATAMDLAPVPADVRAAIEAARAKLPAVRPLYDVLREYHPGPAGTLVLKGQPKPEPGAPDPAYPAGSGRTYGRSATGGPAASPSRIVPLAEIVNMPGFTGLTAQNMYAVIRAPLNYQWLSWSAQRSARSRSVALMEGVDPRWQAAQVALHDRIRQQLQGIIASLLSSQG
ncbi:MAG TPA: hypothetical protein VJT31_30140 [Rugosimonospora sp.]|nr:hypothetical protein [Rugosimonospora sp.]